MPKIEELLTRADESTLQEILGAGTMRLLMNLDQTRGYNRYLRKIIWDTHGPDGLLLNKGFRNILIDLLKYDEALALASDLEILKSPAGVYEKLISLRYQRGSVDEKRLFEYFGLVAPLIEQKDNIPFMSRSQAQYSLFPHQRVATRKVKELLLKEPYRVLLHMPTGSGKTRTAMNIICDYLREYEPKLVVWLANSEELCEQAVNEFVNSWSYLGNRDNNVYRFWGSYSIDIQDVDDGLLVASLPKMLQRIKAYDGIEFITHLGNKTALVIMDEAHQAIAPTYKLIIDSLFYLGKENRLLGLSATPGRTWNNPSMDEELAQFFNRQKVILSVKGYDNPIDYLTENGYLARVNYRQLFYEHGRISKEDISDIVESVDIPIDVLRVLGEDEQRNLKIVVEAERLLKNHTRVILFAPSVESSDLLAYVLQARGYEAYSLTGKTSAPHRRKIIDCFKNDETQSKILCNYGILTTGFDAPKTSAAIIARPTKSLVLYSQMIGRAIRGVKAGGNKEAEIVTIIDSQLPGFRSVSESFNNWEDVWND